MSSFSSLSSSIYELPTPKICAPDFFVMGLQDGEEGATVVRVVSTLITVSVVSSWFNARNIRRLLLFFAHWLSGLMHQLAQVAMATMVTLCWSSEDLTWVIKTLKFVELSSSNMLALTNLAICVNLAKIVSSHHTMSRVPSFSSPMLLFFFLLFSMAASAAAVPFWELIFISETLFWFGNSSEGESDWILAAGFFLEVAVGIFMLLIVALLLIFRLPELHQCWQIHRRIRFYFILSVIAIMVNLTVGIGGLVFISYKEEPMIISVSWAMRHVHIALDTLVLYGALGVPSGVPVEASTGSSDVMSGATKMAGEGQQFSKTASGKNDSSEA